MSLWPPLTWIENSLGRILQLSTVRLDCWKPEPSLHQPVSVHHLLSSKVSNTDIRCPLFIDSSEERKLPLDSTRNWKLWNFYFHKSSAWTASSASSREDFLSWNVKKWFKPFTVKDEHVLFLSQIICNPRHSCSFFFFIRVALNTDLDCLTDRERDEQTLAPKNSVCARSFIFATKRQKVWRNIRILSIEFW